MNRRKSTLCLALAACLLLFFLTGCDTSKDDGSEAEVSQEVQATEEPATYDYDAAKAKFPGDTLIMTEGGSSAYWDEFFYWMNVAVTNILYYNNGNLIEDWNAVYENDLFDQEMSYNAFVKGYAEDAILLYWAVELQYEEMNLTYDEEDIVTVDKFKETYGYDDEAFAEYLSQYYLTEELFEYVNMVYAKYQAIHVSLYGENGVNTPDEEVAAYVESNGYLQAKNLFISKSGTDGTEYSEEELAGKSAAMEECLKELKAYTGDDVEGFFDTLMETYNEDSGASMYPDGYLFREGDMVTEFYEAAKSLKQYGFSEIVESTYGYHIILRLPVDYDAAAYGQEESLRLLTSHEQFNSILEGWKSQIKVQYKDVYEKIVPGEIFAVS